MRSWIEETGVSVLGGVEMFGCFSSKLEEVLYGYQRATCSDAFDFSRPPFAIAIDYGVDLGMSRPRCCEWGIFMGVRIGAFLAVRAFGLFWAPLIGLGIPRCRLVAIGFVSIGILGLDIVRKPVGAIFATLPICTGLL